MNLWYLEEVRYLFVLLASLAALPASAILIRADRDDAEYVELATRYPQSIALPAGGEGTIIAGRWVLTTAGRAQAIQQMKPAPKVTVAGREHEIEAVHLHPDWKPGAANDIALLLLRKDARGIEPLPVYRASDESGKGVAIVGHGETGKIGARPIASDGKKRAAINTIDRVEPRILGLRIKPAEEASDLQGATAPGDSGGPAIIETANGMYVAGVRFATDGDWELYARVSAFAAWIDAVMLDLAAKEAAELMDPQSR
jgi:trypsin